MIPSRRRGRRRPRQGLSLLECLLALAILGGALVVIGQTSTLAMRAGARSRATVEAQILCESLVAELAAGSSTPIPLTDQEVPDAPDWVYSVTTETLDDAGLLSVTVTVTQANDETKPLSFSLTRWIVDPGVEIVEQPKAPVATANANANSQNATTGSPAAFGQPQTGAVPGGLGPGMGTGLPGAGFPGGGFPAGGFPAGQGFPGGGFPAGGFPGGATPRGGPPGGFPGGPPGGALPGGGPPGAGP